MYKLYIDLDGVLVDFEAGVIQATGKTIAEQTPKQMWPLLARTRHFYDKLPWLSDGRDLWNAVLPHEPTILTGLPLGKWAEPQKRSWCARELGPDIPVLTCLSRHKAITAAEYGPDDLKPVLVDDRFSIKESWEDMGGIFIFHTSAENSIKELKEKGIITTQENRSQ